MEKNKYMTIYEDLTQTQKHFLLFVLQTRIESLIHLKNIKKEIGKALFYEQISEDEKKTTNIFDFYELLQSLKQKLINQTKPNHQTHITYIRLEAMLNIIEEVEKNYQNLQQHFFDPEKCKWVVESGYSQLNEMMQIFKEKSEKLIKIDHYKPNDQIKLSEMIECYINDNTKLYIQKTQENATYRNLDINKQHLNFLKRELVHNIDQIIEFVVDKSTIGVDSQKANTVDEYLMANGVDIKTTRQNIEKRAVTVKNLQSIFQSKNKEALDEVSNQMQQDDQNMEISIQIIEILMILNKQIEVKLEEYLTLPPQYNIPEGQEAESLYQFVEGIKKIIQKTVKIEQYSSYTTYNNFISIEGDINAQEKRNRNSTINQVEAPGQEKRQLYSLANQESGLDKQQSDIEKESSQNFSEDKNNIQRLMISRDSMNRCVFAIHQMLDKILEQMKALLDYEKVNFIITQNAVNILDIQGRYQFLEFFEFLQRIKPDFNNYSKTKLARFVPPQVKFLQHIINRIKDKYTQYVSEIVIKKYQSDTFKSIARITRKINEDFDLFQRINYLKQELIGQNSSTNTASINDKMMNIKGLLLDTEAEFGQIDKIIDDINKAIGNPKTMTEINVGTNITDIVSSDNFFFWQTFISTINKFHEFYEDLKIKKKIMTDDQLEKNFTNKTSQLVQSAQEEQKKNVKTICDNYKTLILQDYEVFKQRIALISQASGIIQNIDQPQSKINQ